jgi:four helix bundle protein
MVAAPGFSMTPQQQLRDRSKTFAVRIVRLCHSLPCEWDVRELGKQLLRSATSVAANYRACARARSDKEFCSKMGIVVEECDESQLWIELLPEAHPTIDSSLHRELLKETGELTAIFTASYKTARSNMEKRQAEKRKAHAKNSARA